MRQSERPLYINVSAVAVTILVFFAAMTFWRVREYTDKSVDAQVLFKLVGIGVSLAVPLAAMIAGRLRLMNQVHVTWLLFFGSLMLTSVYATNPQLALMYSTAFVGCFLFAIWLSDFFTETDVATILIGTFGLIAALSIVVYYVNPELGRMHAWLGSEFGANNRIRGIAASPNGLGSMAAFGLILTMLYFKGASNSQRSVMIAAAPFALICLVMSDNRTGMLMLMLAPIAILARRGNRAFNILLVGLAAALVLTVLFLAPELLFGSVSRTGDAAEVTSANGRTMIWSVVLEKIALHPLFGYGYGSATSILPQDPRLFSVAAHTHNLYLEILFSGGLMSFVLFVAALAVTFYHGIRTNSFGPLLIIFFFLLRGMFEPAPFGAAPTYAGYLFFIMVAFVAARAARSQHAGAQLSKQSLAMLDLCRANLRQQGSAANRSTVSP